jgi:hypothetical protein
MFVTAADDAPALVRTDLAAGLARAGHLDLPFPIGPANLAASDGLHGGGYWRPLRWAPSCSCFRVANPTFTPSFPLSQD